MKILHETMEIGLLLVMVIGAAVGYFRFRGRRFGVADLLTFGSLALGSDFLCFQLYQAMAGSHADSAAYGALAAMIALLGLVPVAAGINMVAFVALLVCQARYPAVRYGTLGMVLAALLAHLFATNKEAMLEPGGMLNDDKLAGGHWALESGATSPADCDRQSHARAFREGCYAQLRR